MSSSALFGPSRAVRTASALGACLLFLPLFAEAALYELAPLDFGNGIAVAGTVTTSDATRAIVDWQVTVTTITPLAHFTPANTSSVMAQQVSVSGDGGQLTIRTSADAAAGLDGGALRFRAPNPFVDVGVAIADFTSAFAAGGEAFYMAGASFDFLPLGAADNTDHLAAVAGTGPAGTFALVPLDFGNGVTLSGTLLTDGTRGALGSSNFLDWDIDVDMVTVDIFNSANSALVAHGVQPSADGSDLLVDNPGGRLEFVKGFPGGRRYSLILADLDPTSFFFDTAAYLRGRNGIDILPLNSGLGAWSLTTATSAVPLPMPAPLLAAALLMLSRRRLSKPA